MQELSREDASLVAGGDELSVLAGELAAIIHEAGVKVLLYGAAIEISWVAGYQLGAYLDRTYDVGAFWGNLAYNTFGSGGGGGDSCVHVESRLPDGRRAGDIKVGDTIQLGEEGTLESRVGVVTYSKPSMQRGYRITTQSGISLLCSDTAPICTEDGFVLAPELLGKKVATRVDGKDIVTRFEMVEVLAEVGMIEVQHITVGDRAFWAGATHGQYILHHNKMCLASDYW